jgi:hypothetical protein
MCNGLAQWRMSVWLSVIQRGNSVTPHDGLKDFAKVFGRE